MTETAASSTANLAKGESEEGVWHTGLNQGAEIDVGAAEAGGGNGTCNKKKVVLLSWDRSRGYIFAFLSVSFVIWAAVFFPLIDK